ncbi:glycosyltransferase family 2 protein [Nocardioides sp. zg-DK7169]|uniref:glycosyltransferase family 2 protein n=1 Tax=Nocardioides sp. zg-DK7169 TaxID=2736600 RepID=UPI001552FBB9|nr:glycosyltransferase family 2 protein [Nocardioides sp. zg-DK7169]NPC97945.1 glycosyltransferase family 2 protein [Nocardioides sp. zg-DK7169]
MRFHRPRPLGGSPSISVIVPCYRYGHFLPDAVASALDQPGVDVEVIVVDDASPDDSAEVAHALAVADPRVRVLVHPHNLGHIASYNDGIALARGDYISLLSADDLLTPGALTRAAALFESHPRVGLVYGYARSFTGAVPVADPQVRNWSVYPGREWLGLAARRGRCFISSPEAVVRREVLAERGYDPRLPHSADFALWLRAAAHWDVARVNGPVQAWYRVHDANMHLTTYAGWLTDLQERQRTFELFFAEEVLDVAQLRSHHRTALRALSREAAYRALAARRDGREADAVAYRRFADGLRPASEQDLAWRLEELVGRSIATPLPGAAALRFAGRARHHLRWRFERRYGT